MQQKDENSWKSLEFFSYKLSEAQQSYCAYDKELLVIYMAIKHFWPLVEGRPITGHKPYIQTKR